MELMDRLFIAYRSFRNSSEMSSHDLLKLLGGGGMSASGESVNEETAMRVATVYACTRVLSESVAQLPLILYRRKGNNKERATEHPLYSILHDSPNGWQTSFEFREMLMIHLCLGGNGFALKNRVQGKVRELIPILPSRVQVEQKPDFSLIYKVSNSRGTQTEYTAKDIFHLRGLSRDGVMGMSPITHAREAIGLAIATEKHGSLLFKNGANPAGFVAIESKLSNAKALERAKELEERFAGEQRHKIGILDAGATWVDVSMSNEDAQFLETRKFQKTEICSIFGVPPHKVGDLDRATFSNIEHQSIEFVTNTLMPWLLRWEQRITMALIPGEERSEYFAEFLVDGLLRGDSVSRGKFYGQAVGGPYMTPDEARRLEGLPPIEGGDKLLKPLNMTGNDDEDEK